MPVLVTALRKHYHRTGQFTIGVVLHSPFQMPLSLLYHFGCQRMPPVKKQIKIRDQYEIQAPSCNPAHPDTLLGEGYVVAPFSYPVKNRLQLIRESMLYQHWQTRLTMLNSFKKIGRKVIEHDRWRNTDRVP